MADAALMKLLERIAGALERLAPEELPETDITGADAFIWQGELGVLEPVGTLDSLPIQLLQGIDHVSEILRANTQQFAVGFPANNALLWGARGMGKSSLVKAIFAELSIKHKNLKLVEIQRDELGTIGVLLKMLRAQPKLRFILFCDDLSFDKDDQSYKSLKTVLDGSIAGRPSNVIFYATSNRRHLMPREMMENERNTAIHGGESAEEKISLSDRFGLWLGFYSCDQDTYLSMVDAYAEYFKLKGSTKERHAQALEWATTRGGRSGRVAWQFITDQATPDW